jgi:hypothetical protein
VARPETAWGDAFTPFAKPQGVPLRILRGRAAIYVHSACAVLFTLSWFNGTPCAAHQKWLWPNFFVAEKGPVWLSFDVTWSDRPFTAESGVGAQPLSIVDPSGRRQTASSVFVGKTKSVVEMELTAPGTYRLEAIDPLTYWTQVEDNGQTKWLKKPKNEVTAASIKRSDLYWTKAAAYVTLGEPTPVPPDDDSEPLDLRLEPHPNRVTAGQALKLEVSSFGKPLPRAEVKVYAPGTVGHEPSSVIICGDDGSGTFTPDEAGRFLLACQLEREVTDDPKADIHSFNFYLTLEVQPNGE